MGPVEIAPYQIKLKAKGVSKVVLGFVEGFGRRGRRLAGREIAGEEDGPQGGVQREAVESAANDREAAQVPVVQSGALRAGF